jgi:hypothetical protein
MPIHSVQEKVDLIYKRKLARAVHKKANTKLRTAWEELLQPLKQHIESVMGNQPKLQTQNPSYYKFNQRYLILLRAVRDMLKNHMRTHALPPSVVAEKLGIESGGVWWTHWVDPDIRERVMEKFYALPRTPQTNYREPFPMTLPDPIPKVRQKLRGKILEAMSDNEYNMWDINLSESGRDHLIRESIFLNEALARCDALARKDKTPKYYTALFSKEELLATGLFEA